MDTYFLRNANLTTLRVKDKKSRIKFYVIYSISTNPIQINIIMEKV